MIRDTQRTGRIKALKFEQQIEEWKRREGDLMVKLKKKPVTAMSDLQKAETADALLEILVGLDHIKIDDNYTQLEFVYPFTELFMKSLESIE